MFSFRGGVWAGLLFPGALCAQISVEGVADRTTYNDQVQVRVPAEAGYTYEIFLGKTPFPVSTWVTIDAPDYYELYVERTETGAGNKESRLVRFIVADSSRLGTEWGLPTHTPAPVIQSSAEELAAASLRLLAPASFPAGYPIPVAAWLEDGAGHAVRANGLLEAIDQPAIQLRRGAGSGFLAAASEPVIYAPHVQQIGTSITIEVDPETSWTSVGGVLGGSVAWPADARVRVTSSLTVGAGATLTIGAGAVVCLNGGIDITNNGTIVIEGVRERPVVFMPATAGQPWGGFIMRHGTGEIHATGTIFTGSGAVANWFGANGNPASHRDEQALFYVQDDQTVELTDCAAFDLAGQLGHSVGGGNYLFTRLLVQRYTTGGEYTGARFTVNDSAFIESPVDTPSFIDGDNDSLYLASGIQNFTNTLFGWTKDDGVDSGASGVGTLTYDQCWFEALFHEGNSLSGSKTVSTVRTVYLDCGQGLEDGYGGPNARAEQCLFLACQAGARHGDNYPSIGAYTGIFVLTNSILLHNHRDIFAYNWQSTGWTNNFGQMRARGNWLTATDTNFPDNAVWNPASDSGRLSVFGAAGVVGMGLTLWPGAHTLEELASGAPIGLSRFSTNLVTVDYTIETTGGDSSSGTVEFPPGRVRQVAPLPSSFSGVLRLGLSNPGNAELTGQSELFLQHFPAASQTVLIPRGAEWRYLDTGANLGGGWTASDYDATGWLEGPAELGYGDNDEATVVRSNREDNSRIITTYFRRSFMVDDPGMFDTLELNLLRDDGAVVYVNGMEVYRSNMPGGAIDYNTGASSSISGGDELIWLTTMISPARLQTGVNVLAVEIHQRDTSSSDISFNLELIGKPAPPAARVEIGRLGGHVVVYWRDPAWLLERSLKVDGGWTNAGVNSPYIEEPNGIEFFRIREQ